MSQHTVVQEEKKFVFGWDQPLQSFYLQVHDTTRDEDDQIVAWQSRGIYEVEELVRKARKQGLDIPYETQVKLYGEKDDGR
jgi:hypothetical protein